MKKLLHSLFLVIASSFTTSLLILFLLLNFYKQPATSTYLQTEQTPLTKYLTPIALSQKNSGLEGIECIYVINLQRRMEKWEQTKQTCEALNLHPNRVNAVDGKKLSKIAIQELLGPYPTNIYAGQIGCILSHISAIKDGYERGFKTIWILEDDIEVKRDIQLISRLITDLSEKDPEWDIFYTDPDQKNARNQIIPSNRIDPRPDQKLNPLKTYLNRAPLNESIIKSGLRFGAHSMILSRSGMKKILDYFTHVYLWTPYDLDIHYIPSIREYSSTQFIVTQKIGGVHDTHFRFFYIKETFFRGTGRTFRQYWDEYWGN